METHDNRLYRIYNTETELQEEMDRLRAQGYGEEDMYIITNRDQQLSIYRGMASGGNDGDGGSWWDRFKAFLMGEDLARDHYFAQMGLTAEDRNRYYDKLQQGKYLLYVDKDYGKHFDEGARNVGGTNVFERNDTKTEEERLALHEERLQVDKNRVQTGEVNVEKRIVEEQQTVEVPVEREEVYVERRPVNETVRDVNAGVRDGMAHTYEQDGKIHIPVTEEQVEVTKKDVVTEEIVVGKRKVTDTEVVSDTVRREEADIHDTTNGLDNPLNRTERGY